MAVQRRKKLLLQLSRKMEAIDLINKGKPLAMIAWAYGVGLSTVSNWKKKQYDIQRYCSILHMTQASSVLDERYTMRKPNDQTLDGALYIWYEEALDRGERITGKVLQQKAKEINLKLTGVDNFTASMGWLTRWKKRHGIVGKFAKKPDERAMVPLPAVEDGEDPLKLCGEEDVLEDGWKKKMDANSSQKSRSESKEVPFLTSSKYPPIALEIKNVQEIIKNSTSKENRSKGGIDNDNSEVDFPQSDVEEMEEEDSFSALNSSISSTQRALPSSSDDVNMSSDDHPVVRQSRSQPEPSEMYEIVDSSDEESESDLPAPLNRRVSSTQRAIPSSSDAVTSSHDHPVVRKTRFQPGPSEMYEILYSSDEEESGSELSAPLNRSVSSTQNALPSSSDAVNMSSHDHPVVRKTRFQTDPSEMYEIVTSSDEESGSELPAPLDRSVSSTQRGMPTSGVGKMSSVEDDPHRVIAVPESQPKPTTSQVYEIADSSDEEDVNAVEQRETTVDSDLVYMISDDSEEEAGMDEVEMEEELKGSFLSHMTSKFKKEEDSSSR